VRTPISAPSVTVRGMAMIIGMMGALRVLAKRVQSETRTVPPVYAPATELMLDIIAKPRSVGVMGTAELSELRREPAPPFRWMKY